MNNKLRNKNLSSQLLNYLYYDKNLTQKEIGHILNYSQSNIYKLFKRFNIKSKSIGYHNIRHGKTMSNTYCKDCGIKISDYRHKYCLKCFSKKNLAKWQKGQMRGKRNYAYKDGRTLRLYKCKICDNDINYQNFYYYKGYCQYCERQLRTFKYVIRKFKYKNVKFYSSWEANFAKWCDLSGIKWEYELRTFNLVYEQKERLYTPDFYLPDFDVWIEIKGYWRKDAIKKFNNFKILYKNIDIRVFDRKKLLVMGIIDD